MKQGRRAEAANMYYRSSFNYSSPQKERIILQAAEISASLSDQNTTKNYLSKVPERSLNTEGRVRYRYIQSLLALQNKQANRALNLLPYDTSRLSKGLRDKIELVRKRSIEMGGKYPNRPTPKPSEIKVTKPSVSYSQQPQQATTQTPRPPHYSQAPIIQHQQSPQAQARQPLPHYAQRPNINNQQHSAQQHQAPPQPGFTLPPSSNKIALLLPDKGALGKVGDEIFQGVKVAQSQYGANTLSKRYPVNAANALQQYQQAVADGADIVVGPLDKGSLATLMAQPQLLSTPILSLNYLTSGNAPPTLYQFGLSPEDEARQIAEFAIARGQTNGVIMTPDSNWGKRLANAFAQTYQQRGGNLLGAEFYPNNKPSSYLKRIQGVLSQATGANMVFLAASPTQARLIRPLLKDQAGLLPVYATSHIFSGREESNKDVDLDGIIYTEIPLILDRPSSGSLDELKFPRLYAMGMDAVMIAKTLPQLVQNQTARGKTGQIRLGPQRRIQRQLEFATFINGQPQRLGN